ncbi:MAG: DUF3179 domain-containing protein [Acidimicrobiia bacterium]
MRSVAWLAALMLVAAACTTAAEEGEVGRVSESTGPALGPTSASAAQPIAIIDGEFPEGPSALRDRDHPDFPEPLVDPSQILSGGPPPDGIPPIDDPRFVTVEEADGYLQPEEPVVVLEIDGDARAYPVQVLIWHEIVNDVVGGVPVSITYCPLCNSAVSYERQIQGAETTFGTSGRLFSSALVMYDRATESLWTHFDGRAVVGVLTGHQLEPIASPLLAWGNFKDSYPNGGVLDRESTGFNRPYGTNPYRGYDNPDGIPFLFRGDADDRARELQRVVGVALNGEAVAWSLGAISGGEARATHGEVGGQRIVILWRAGQSTALESEQVAGGRDVGSVGVFAPELDQQILTFGVEGDRFVDAETGSVWTVTGEAVEGPMAGASLERIHHLDTFWFAWASYRPGTALVEP